MNERPFVLALPWGRRTGCRNCVAHLLVEGGISRPVHGASPEITTVEDVRKISPGVSPAECWWCAEKLDSSLRAPKPEAVHG